MPITKQIEDDERDKEQTNHKQIEDDERDKEQTNHKEI